MILHVASPSVFLGPLQRLVRAEFHQQDHRFWFNASNDMHGIDEGKKVYVQGKGFFEALKAYAKLVNQMHTARIVMLHGLFNPRILVLLSLMPWLLPKCYWVILGGDLYQYKKPKVSWRSRIIELFRRLVIRRVGHLVTYVKGDVELARQWYGAIGIHHECIMYLSNVVDFKMAMGPSEVSDHDGLKILFGNSADPSNNHIEALERLLPFKDQAIEIWAPLSYGDQNHAKKVISQGKAWFGDKFVPMTDFMPFEQYFEFLKSVDVAIFNHQRQQAMGNTITLLGMGKTVFMRSDVSQWELFANEGITVLDIEHNDLKILDADAIANNVQIVREKFSRNKLVEQYARIFDS